MTRRVIRNVYKIILDSLGSILGPPAEDVNEADRFVFCTTSSGRTRLHFCGLRAGFTALDVGATTVVLEGDGCGWAFDDRLEVVGEVGGCVDPGLEKTDVADVEIEEILRPANCAPHTSPKAMGFSQGKYFKFRE